MIKYFHEPLTYREGKNTLSSYQVVYAMEESPIIKVTTEYADGTIEVKDSYDSEPLVYHVCIAQGVEEARAICEALNFMVKFPHRFMTKSPS